MFPIDERVDAGPRSGAEPQGTDEATVAAPEPTLFELPAARSPAPAARRPNEKEGSAPVFETIDAAAEKLSIEAGALRARCRRAARREGDKVVAPLGGGIVAIKFGRSWRVRFPTP